MTNLSDVIVPSTAEDAVAAFGDGSNVTVLAGGRVFADRRQIRSSVLPDYFFPTRARIRLINRSISSSAPCTLRAMPCSIDARWFRAAVR